MKYFLLWLLLCASAFATTYNSDGTLSGGPSSINTLIAGATAGDVITVPNSSFTWGVGGDFIALNKAVTLRGLGSSTVITISSSAPSGTSGLIKLQAAATVDTLKFIPSASHPPFSASASGWRITNVTYNEAAASTIAYFCYIGTGSFGVIDNNNITGGGGTNELIYGRGPAGSWDTAYVGGTANAVFIEKNTFNGPGYVCDANADAIFVVRGNKVTGQMKVDGHGYNTNNGGRGVRAMEVYLNQFTNPQTGNNISTEIRGGVGYHWGNNTPNGSLQGNYYRLTEYSVNAPGSLFSQIYQTPTAYPLPDQIGTGPGAIGVQAGGGQPYYFFLNYKGGLLNSSKWDGVDTNTRNTNAGTYAIGATSITLASGSTSVIAGNYVNFAGDNTPYLVTVGISNGAAGTITISPGLVAGFSGAKVMSYGPIRNYRQQTGNPASSFTFGPSATCIIQADRDAFFDATSFTGASGVGSGPLASRPSQAAMQALPALAKTAWWATDQGSWNLSISGTQVATTIELGDYCQIASVGTTPTDFTLIGARNNTVGTTFVATAPGVGDGTVTAPQGQLSVWSGSAWVTDYTPYPYPFNSTPQPPTVVSATINSAGDTLTVVLSVSCTTGSGGNGGMSVTASGGAAPLAYSTGSGSSTYVYSFTPRVINQGESVVLNYVQPGDGIQTTSDGADLASFTNQAVTNGSTVGATPFNAVQPIGLRGGGF